MQGFTDGKDKPTGLDVVKKQLLATGEELGEAARIGMTVYEKRVAVPAVSKTRTAGFEQCCANLGSVLQRSEPVSNDISFIMKWNKLRDGARGSALVMWMRHMAPRD